MHILFSCNEYPPAPYGGIGVFTRLLAEGLVELGVSVTVAGVYGGLQQEIRENVSGVTVVRLPAFRAGRFSGVLNRVRFRRWAEEYIAARGVDVIEYPDFHTYYLKRHRIPAVLRLHGSNTYYAQHSDMAVSMLNSILEKRAVRRVDHLVGVSQHVLDSTLSIMGVDRGGNAAVIHNFCDESKFAPETGAGVSNSILYFGTLADAKGVFLLAEAANSFLAELPDAELCFIGRDAGERGERAADRIRRTVGSQVAGRVKVHGPVSNEELPAYIAKARMCVFPSLEEAFGLTVIEAMACGKPVIASTRGAHREIVTDGRDGILADPRDGGALSRAIIDLYRDQALRRHFGEAARLAVNERFSMQAGLNRNYSFYKSIVS